MPKQGQRSGYHEREDGHVDQQVCWAIRKQTMLQRSADPSGSGACMNTHPTTLQSIETTRPRVTTCPMMVLLQRMHGGMYLTAPTLPQTTTCRCLHSVLILFFSPVTSSRCLDTVSRQPPPQTLKMFSGPQSDQTVRMFLRATL